MCFVLSLQQSGTCSPTSMQQQGSFHFQFHQSLAGILTPTHGMITSTLHSTQSQKSSCTTKVRKVIFFLWVLPIKSFSPGKSTFLQVNPRYVWPATVQLSTDLASPSLRSWSTLHARRRMPMGTLYGMSTARTVRSWRPQVLARPCPQTHYITVHPKTTLHHIRKLHTTPYIKLNHRRVVINKGYTSTHKAVLIHFFGHLGALQQTVNITSNLLSTFKLIW